MTVLTGSKTEVQTGSKIEVQTGSKIEVQTGSETGPDWLRDWSRLAPRPTSENPESEIYRFRGVSCGIN